MEIRRLIITVIVAICSNNSNNNDNMFLHFESSVNIDAEWADPWLKSLVFQCEGDYS